MPTVQVGFAFLDALTQGFHPGHLIVLAGLPGTGRKSLALNMLLRSARFHGVCGALFALELDFEEVLDRLISAQGGVDRNALRTGALDAVETGKRLKALGALQTLPIHIEEQEFISVRKLQAAVEHHQAQTQHRIGLVVIDCLDRISGPEGRGSAAQATPLKARCLELKQAARRLGVPVVVVTRLNRFPPRRLPKLSDLPGAGAIEAVADTVLLLHNGLKPLPSEAQGLEEEPQEQDRSAALVIAKHRNGPIGILSLYFEFEYARYREMYRNI
jgi:replicative DNA helicase